jgi:O-antigen ligase
VSAASARARGALELGAAGAVATAAGALSAAAPAVALAAAPAALAFVAAAAARLSLTAGLLVTLVIGHAVVGQLYILELAPETLGIVFDVIVVILLGAAVLGAPAGRRRTPASRWLVGAFVALCVIQLFNTLVPSVAYGVLGLRQLALAALTVLAVREVRLDARERRWVLGAMVLGWAVNVAFAARQWLGAFTPAELRWIENTDATYLVGTQIRLLGAMQSNQDFAFVAAIALPAVAVLAFRARGFAARAALWTLAFASLAVLFGSLVRSGLVGGVVGATVALVASAAQARDRRRLLGAGVLVAAVLWLTAVAAPGAILPENKAEALEQRLASFLDLEGDVAFNARRQASWPYALEQLAAHPFGAGPGAAGPLSQARVEEAPLGRVVPDNGYLLVAVQLGVPGLVLFVAMLVALALELRRRAASSPVAAAALGSLVAAMTAMLAGNYWSLVAPSVLLAVLIGLGLQEPAARRRA